MTEASSEERKGTCHSSQEPAEVVSGKSRSWKLSTERKLCTLQGPAFRCRGCHYKAGINVQRQGVSIHKGWHYTYTCL